MANKNSQNRFLSGFARISSKMLEVKNDGLLFTK